MYCTVILVLNTPEQNKPYIFNCHTLNNSHHVLFKAATQTTALLRNTTRALTYDTHMTLDQPHHSTFCTLPTERTTLAF